MGSTSLLHMLIQVQVKVLWVLNGKQSAWEQQLPTEVSNLLAASRKELTKADL